MCVKGTASGQPTVVWPEIRESCPLLERLGLSLTFPNLELPTPAEVASLGFLTRSEL